MQYKNRIVLIEYNLNTWIEIIKTYKYSLKLVFFFIENLIPTKKLYYLIVLSISFKYKN